MQRRVYAISDTMFNAHVISTTCKLCALKRKSYRHKVRFFTLFDFRLIFVVAFSFISSCLLWRCQFEMVHVSSHSRRNCLVCASVYVCEFIMGLFVLKKRYSTLFSTWISIKWKSSGLAGYIAHRFFVFEFIYLRNHHHSILSSTAHIIFKCLSSFRFFSRVCVWNWNWNRDRVKVFWNKSCQKSGEDLEHVISLFRCWRRWCCP